VVGDNRNGTVNLLVCIDITGPWRHVKVTERRQRLRPMYARTRRCPLSDVEIRVVQDNLSIHSAGALYQAFAPAEARRILRRL
jgi:hypothetical protein